MFLSYIICQYLSKQHELKNTLNILKGCYDVLWSYVEKYNKIVMTVVILMSLIEVSLIYMIDKYNEVLFSSYI